MSHADQEPPREPTVSGTARARPRASAPALGAAGAQNRARVDFGALKQWAGTGKVKRRPTASHHRRYRLGQWQSQSASSWNPPNTPHSSSPGASGGNRSLASVDISHKPSESRRSSIISLQSAGAGSGYASENEGDSEDECKGPLAQMLLKENDEIWNNSAFRFTFYSPVTGTVRSTDVQTLRTDHADGLDALIRLATGDHSADNSSKHVVVPEISLGPSRRTSLLPNNNGGSPEVRESAGGEALDEPVPFYAIILGNGVITLHCTNVPHVRNTIARLMLDEELIKLTPDYITYLLLDDITDTLVPITRLLELEVDAIDELVLILTRAEHDDVLKRIGIERRHALWLVRLLHGKAEVLRSIERRIHAKVATDSSKSPYRLPPARRRGKPASTTAIGASSRLADDEDGSIGDEYDADLQESQLLTSDEEEGDLYGWMRSRPGRGGGGGDLRDEGGGYSAELPAEDVCYDPARQQFLPDVTKYLADVHDHLIALTASVHHCERILARAHGNYLARINLELTHASNTTNQLATQMTVLAGIFLPLNLVAGIFGMNVKVPGRDRDDLRDFAIILGAMGFFVIASLAVCRWRRII
ncbi:CorA metal ion transporter [Coemansia sp. RSA 1694]|nr:CorA metal ion transporter [Coemansia sp. RSA 1694]